MSSLAQAQEDRRQRAEEMIEAQVDSFVDAVVDRLDLASVPNYQLVSPRAKEKLRPILNHYRKMAHPWTACYRDLSKKPQFGPAGAKRVCSVLTDLEKGTTHWRHGGKRTRLSDPCAGEPLDQEGFDLLLAISEIDYKSVIQEVLRA